MSSSKKANKYKESPYYSGDYCGGGHAELKKSQSKRHDTRNSDENKLPKLGTHFNVLKLNRNSSKREASSSPWEALFDQGTIIEPDSELLNDGFKVKELVSGFEKSLEGSKESKKSAPAIFEENSSVKEHETDKHNATSDHGPLNGFANVPSATLSNSSQSPVIVAVPHATVNPFRSFDLNSASINAFPLLADPPLPPVPRHPKFLHIAKEEENGDSAQYPKLEQINKHKQTQRTMSMEAQPLIHLSQYAKGSLAPKSNSIVSNNTMKTQDKHGVESTLSFPLDAHPLGWHSQSMKSAEIQDSKDLSPTEGLHSFIGRKNIEQVEPFPAELKRDNSMDALHNVFDSHVSFATKDENGAVKIIGTQKDEKVLLSGVASAFYNGGSLSLHGVLCHPSIDKINEFLDNRRDELHAGVPGKWLTIVLGSESSDLSTIAATIVYAYFLSITTREDQLCIVPLVNMVRADLALHPDVSWLLNSIGLHISSLLFLDEINLSYFHRFGSLRLVLVNHTKLCPGQESFKDDVEEILAVHEEVGDTYPHLKTVLSDKDVGSSCTLIAEQFTKHHPELLAGRAICRLLFAGILLDTTNLSSQSATRRDASMVTLLLNGAGKFGRNGLYKILKQKFHDLTHLNTTELLRKQFKMLNFGHKGVEGHSHQVLRYEENVGMSSLPIPVGEVLMWEEESPLAIADFPRCMALGLFVLVTGFYETPEMFKREVLVVCKDNQLLESISNFLLTNKNVKFISMPLSGLPSCLKGFYLEGKRISRTFIQSIIEDYFS